MENGAEATTASAPASSFETIRARLREAERRGDTHEAANLRLELRYLADLHTTAKKASR